MRNVTVDNILVVNCSNSEAESKQERTLSLHLPSPFLSQLPLLKKDIIYDEARSSHFIRKDRRQKIAVETWQMISYNAVLEWEERFRTGIPFFFLSSRSKAHKTSYRHLCQDHRHARKAANPLLITLLRRCGPLRRFRQLAMGSVQQRCSCLEGYHYDM